MKLLEFQNNFDFIMENHYHMSLVPLTFHVTAWIERCTTYMYALENVHVLYYLFKFHA